VLAAKGGHNDEMHNHNDAGSFIIHAGREDLIADPGAGHYTLGYFGPMRYEHFAASSLGHSVPVPNGQLQQAGRQFAARLLEHSAGEEADVLRLDLRAAYPAEARLELLERRIALHRHAGLPGGGWVELEDRFAFQGGPGSFESALITFGQAAVEEEGSVLIRGERAGLRVRCTTGNAGVRVEHYPAVDLAEGRRDACRVVFFLPEPCRSGCLRIEMAPAIAEI